jgi:CHAT domain-containing protein/tetratricopeptide (TPR) repeat protein
MGAVSQKIDVEKFRPEIGDSLLLQQGVELISNNDSTGFLGVFEEIKKKIRKKSTSVSSLMIITLWADELVDQGQTEQSFEILQKAGEQFQERFDTMTIAWAFYHKSVAYYHYRKAQYKQRVAHHQAEIEVIRHIDPEHPLLLESYSQLMTAHWSARNVKEGFEYYQKILEMARPGKYDYYRVNAYLNAVNILKFYKPSMAAQFADYTNYLAGGSQKPYFLSDPYFFISLGSANTATNRHNEALELYQQGLKVFKSSGVRNPIFLASLYYYIGVSYKNLVYYDSDTSLTENYHRQADLWLDSALMTVKERIGKDHPIYSRVVNLKGQNLNNWGKYEEALPINEQAWTLVEKQHGRYNKYYSQQAIHELARSQLRSGRHKEALETYHRQVCYFLEVDDTVDFYNTIEIDTALHAGSHEELMLALVGKATALELLMGEKVDANMVSLILAHYEQALAVTDALTAKSLTDDGLEKISAHFSDLAKRIVNFLSRNDFPDEVVERVYRMVSESKAHALLAGMYRGNGSHESGDDSLAVRVNELENQLQRLDASRSGFRYEALMEELLDLQKERFLNSFGKPVRVDKIRLPRLADIENRPVNDGLQPEEVVMDYFLTPEFIGRFEISSDRVAFFSRPYTADLENQISGMYRAVKTGNGELASLAGQKLYNYLLGEISPSTKKITVIPDASLFLVPFEMLSSGDDLLIHTVSVAYRYSSHLYSRELTSSVPAQNPVMAVFAPVFDSQQLARQPAAGDRGWSNPDTSGVFRTGSHDMLKSIPYTEEEFQKIKLLFDENGRAIRVFNRNGAMESVFKKEAGQNNLLHIATHGHADLKNPRNSGLFLVPDGKDDGFLFMDEIFDLDLHADLVVLSACKTGVGEVVKGEGVMALPRGFIHAGAANVVASMWKVHDERTKELMIAFYQYLLKGFSYEDALRQAKIQCINNGFLPVDWAGFVLVEG